MHNLNASTGSSLPTGSTRAAIGAQDGPQAVGATTSPCEHAVGHTVVGEPVTDDCARTLVRSGGSRSPPDRTGREWAPPKDRARAARCAVPHPAHEASGR